jgi:hypothetical protein
MELSSVRASEDPKAKRCRRKFLRFYPGGFTDEDYVDLERGYKWEAHLRWKEHLAPSEMGRLIEAEKFGEIASHAVRIESRTNLLFSFEKMALRDAVKSRGGARIFATGLFDFLHGPGPIEARFARWAEAVGKLPRRQTRVLTWPVLTVFPFLAQPSRHVFLKPNVTRRAAEAYGFDFVYASRPEWPTYASLLAFASRLERDLADMEPADRIDIQSFIWVQGSDEYG